MADSDVHYSDARVPCKTCGRSFAPEVLTKHAKICKKNQVASEKRKAFDSSKQRVVEGELSFKQIRQAQKQPNDKLKSGVHTPKHNVTIPPPKSHWREKHADFINTIRNARVVQKALDSGGPLPPPPPPSINPDYIQCPYCSRRFSKTAAERHINFCKEQQSRLPRAKADASATAKQNARLGYQAPKLKAKTTPGAPPAGAGPSRPGGPAARGAASRGGVAGGRGRGGATQDSYGAAGDSRGGGRGRQPQQRAGAGPRTQNFEQPHHDSYSHKPQQQQPKQNQRQQQQQQQQHRQPQFSPDLEEPGDFYSSPRDFYTPYMSPQPRGGASGHAPVSHASSGSSGYNSARYADKIHSQNINKNNSSYSGRHHQQHQQQQQHFGSCSNGSNSPYQNLEERSRKSDGKPVRSDTQHHFLSTINSDDGVDVKGHFRGEPESGSSAPGSSRRNLLQSTPAPFCYECGAKYPVSTAKFCCQCGVKRAACG